MRSAGHHPARYCNGVYKLRVYSEAAESATLIVRSFGANHKVFQSVMWNQERQTSTAGSAVGNMLFGIFRGIFKLDKRLVFHRAREFECGSTYKLRSQRPWRVLKGTTLAVHLRKLGLVRL